MIDISKILQYAPKGLELYHRGRGYMYFDDVKFGEIRLTDSLNDIERGVGWRCCVDMYGREHEKGECLLFPSKEYTSWKSWQQILFPKSIGSIVTDSMDGLFIITNEGLKDSRGKLVSIQVKESDKYASPEDTKTFFNFLNINGFEWNNKNKTIEKQMTPEETIMIDEIIIKSELGVDKITYDLSGVSYDLNAINVKGCGQMEHEIQFSRGDVIVCKYTNELLVYIENDLAIDYNGNKHKIVSTCYRLSTQIERMAFETQLNKNGFVWDKIEQNVVQINPCKFKVGDWVVRNSNGETLQITDYSKSVYTPPYSPTFELSNHRWITRGKLESDFHLWSMSDVKCGDILVDYGKDGGHIPEKYAMVEKYDDISNMLTTYCIYYAKEDIFDGYGNYFRPTRLYYPCSDEEKSRFYGFLSRHNYSWDADEIKAERDEQLKNDKSKIDLKTLDYVLVRENDTEKWKLAIFSYYDKKYKDYVCNNGLKYKQCVPYNDETSYLLGTMYFNI